MTEDGSITSAMFLLLLALPLLAMGRWMQGLGLLISSLVLGLCRAVADIKEEDKQEIRFNVLNAHDVLQEMIEWEAAMEGKECTAELRAKARLIVDTGLAAFAKKYGRQGKEPEELSLWCQQAAYIGFRCFANDDELVAASLALLALVAKDERVQERSLYEADRYGLNIPIECMSAALARAQETEPDGDGEQLSAELQRKGCLMLGAISASPDVAAQVAQEGGIDAILSAVDWFRCHADVANWSLWALFTICYENYTNKIALVQSQGLPIVVEVMRNCPKSPEVARHGIAILFDLMRQDDDRPSHGKLDVWKIRKAAIDAGVYDVLVNAMSNFYDEMDIMMMGQEILVGTGYQGEIPQYSPIR